jgi:hypothetical protein
MKRFKLIWTKEGSGWRGMRVAIDAYIEQKNIPGEICLTYDAENAKQVCMEIDELIDELQKLKTSAKRRFKPSTEFGE